MKGRVSELAHPPDLHRDFKVFDRTSMPAPKLLTSHEPFVG